MKTDKPWPNACNNAPSNTRPPCTGSSPGLGNGRSCHNCGRRKEKSRGKISTTVGVSNDNEEKPFNTNEKRYKRKSSAFRKIQNIIHYKIRKPESYGFGNPTLIAKSVAARYSASTVVAPNPPNDVGPATAVTPQKHTEHQTDEYYI